MRILINFWDMTFSYKCVYILECDCVKFFLGKKGVPANTIAGREMN